MHTTADHNATFDVIPTEDGLGYMVRLCRNGNCAQTFISSMHLAWGNHSQVQNQRESFPIPYRTDV